MEENWTSHDIMHYDIRNLILTRDEHYPGHEQKHDAVKCYTLLQDDNEDLSIHDYCIEQPCPHEEQTGQEIPVIVETDTLAKKHTVVITPQYTHFAVIAVWASWRSVCLTVITEPVIKEENIKL